VDSDTLTAYRLVSSRWAPTAFSGDGARKYGGRWHSPGRPLVYLSETRALAALELLVHLTTTETRAKPFAFIEVAIPIKHIEVLTPSALSYAWKTSPPTRESTHVGDQWLREGRSLALRVPSVIIPEESNILLNVAHPDFPALTTGTPRKFTFDQRINPGTS
jgi:RES domain-containing protein